MHNLSYDFFIDNIPAVSCGEFCGQTFIKDLNDFVPPDAHDLHSRPDERLKLQLGPLEEGPTIIYVPTRKETLNLAKFLCKFGVKAAAYNAKVWIRLYL